MKRDYSDTEIIECLRNRQGYVVRYLSARYMPMIRQMISRYDVKGVEARDIFQDGLLILLQKIDSDNFTLTCRFTTYLFCVCSNLCKRIVSKQIASVNYFHLKLDEPARQDFTEWQDTRLYRQIFYEMFDTIDPVGKSILRLYWQEHTAKEIGEILGYADNYVRKKKCEVQGELILKIQNHPEYIALKKSEDLVEKTIFE